LGEVKENVMRSDNFLTSEKIEKISDHQLDLQRLALETILNKSKE
jgi:hypothetical protein